ncbi:hypothetical protein H4R99_006051 [Coemansia sp. RSA 1722]|nr:hypothetical protein IWW45_002656 [Coemansia sp. RSA 485]KAJ2593595.1 hypothetical protein H4R99_006051 [Coemansia sp. RSA 1722]KAJ2597875.1 hypothetical protein GGF39_002868 [Coemansia sp. RSA 1721]KAJ2640435.1 hypothetical protein GGF40_000083 [Coemansia sp. RSA 1286]
MSLFSGLPAIDTQPGEKDHDKEHESPQKNPEKKPQSSAKTQSNTASWSYPELAPNLRRPKPSYKPTGNTATTSKHPHSLPRDPASLISRWNAVCNEAQHTPAQETLTDSNNNAPTTTVQQQQQEHFSLSEYMPVIPHVQRSGQGSKTGSLGNGTQVDDGFDPFEEYNPAAPNSYHAYKNWLGLKKKERKQNSRRLAAAGEPSVCIMLTNMADDIDDSLERETQEECEAFGQVQRCKALVYQEAEQPYERVRLYVEFSDMAAASRAREALDQRFFDGRHISAIFVQSIPDVSTDHSS